MCSFQCVFFSSSSSPLLLVAYLKTNFYHFRDILNYSFHLTYFVKLIACSKKAKILDNLQGILYIHVSWIIFCKDWRMPFLSFFFLQQITKVTFGKTRKDTVFSLVQITRYFRWFLPPKMSKSTNLRKHFIHKSSNNHYMSQAFLMCIRSVAFCL